MIVDAHHHFWDPATADYPWLTDELAAIRRAFGPDDLAPLLRSTGVDATVLVQTRSSLEETVDFLAVAGRTPWIRGVVGWVDLTDPAIDDALARLREGPGGERLVGHPPPGPRRAGSGLAHPRRRRPRHRGGRAGRARLRPARATARAAGGARPRPAAAGRPVRHRPHREAADRDRRARAMGVAASPPFGELEHVACKVSGHGHRGGLVDAGRRPTSQPYVDHVLEVFGPDRLLFGSDWPVCLLAATYEQVVDAARQALAGLTDDERAAVFGATAARIYRL